jgi:hypothetical protein
MSTNFRKPSLLAPNSYQWSDLKAIVEQVRPLLAGDEQILFDLHNYLEANELGQASEFHANNVSKIGQAVIKEQFNLLLYNAQGRTREAVALENLNNLDMNSELNHLLLAQNKRSLDDNADISSHMTFLTAKQLTFYKDWLEIQRLIKTNSVPELKGFVKERFLTVPEFKPLIEAKGMVN